MNRRKVIIFIAGAALAVAGLSWAAWTWYRPGCAPSVQTYLKLLEKIPATYPGRGASDYPGNLVADIPKSYAMVLAAEVNRMRSGEIPERDRALINTAGQWLLDHCDENRDGVTGWGLPFPWDAYGDGTNNPADTEYTITTGIVINALLDWWDYDFTAPRGRILETVSRALAPYLGSQFSSPSGLFTYSLSVHDLSYDCFNPAAYLAGQMQRFSLYAGDNQLKIKVQQAADRVMNVMLSQKKIDPGGAWYWSYSIQENNVSNDLPHAAYIIEGIRNYMTCGGSLSRHFDWTAVYAHLQAFSAKDHSRWYAFPVFSGLDKDRPPRLYDLGMALYLFSRCDASLERAKALATTICSYRSGSGHYLKWPLSSKLGRISSGNLSVQEYEAYLLMGLSYYLYPNQSLDIRLPSSRTVIEAVYELVPLTFHETPALLAELFLHPDRMSEPLIKTFENRNQLRLYDRREYFQPLEEICSCDAAQERTCPPPPKGFPVEIFHGRAGAAETQPGTAIFIPLIHGTLFSVSATCAALDRRVSQMSFFRHNSACVNQRLWSPCA